jgi:hypothetical protein
VQLIKAFPFPIYKWVMVAMPCWMVQPSCFDKDVLTDVYWLLVDYLLSQVMCKGLVMHPWAS